MSRRPTGSWYKDWYEQACEKRDLGMKQMASQPEAYPVNLNPTPARPLQWYPHPPDMIKQWKDAIDEGGVHGPFTQQVLETLSMDLNTPTDRKQLMGGALPTETSSCGGSFLGGSRAAGREITGRAFSCPRSPCKEKGSLRPQPPRRRGLPSISTKSQEPCVNSPKEGVNSR